MTMDFTTAVRTCLTEKYAAFQGRASRSEYWWFFLAIFIVAIVTQLIWGLLYLIFALAIFCPALAAAFRRLQDTGKPGWYAVIPFGLSVVTSLISSGLPSEEAMAAGQMPSMGSMLFFALVGIVQLAIAILFLWWLTRPSDPETNAYGPPPAPQA